MCERAESECDSEFEKESDVTCIASFQAVRYSSKQPAAE